MTELEKQCRQRLELRRLTIREQRGQADARDTSLGFNPIEVSVLRRLELELPTIEAALDRLDQDRYGLCEACGARIPDERLLARPEAPLCIGCQQRLEHKTLGFYKTPRA